ncbi:MAG: hypothetical protein JNJ98_21010 [Gemmatimonadetes bacterium]|nr:hypothetical protein [Gemmatimonadota bacterium]
MESVSVGRGRSPRTWEWALALMPFLALVLVHWNDLPSRQAGDYAQYLLHAKALAEGRPYDATGYIYTPYAALISPRVQPPGWPLILTPVVSVFGLGLLVPKILVTVAGLLMLAFVMRRMSRDDDPTLLALAIGGSGLALETTYATNSPLSDLPFCAMLWGIVLLADSPRALTWGRTALIAALTVYAVATRIAGVAVFPALLLLAWRRPRDRRVLLALVAAFVVAGVVGIFVVGPDKVPFMSQMFRSPEVMWGRITAFGDKYRLPFFEATMYPFPWDLANDGYHLLAMAMVPFGALAFLKRYGQSFLGCLVATYALMILLAPVADARYLWPFWPVLLYWVVAGLRSLVSRLPRVAPHATRLALVLGMVVLAGGFTRGVRTPSPDGLLTDPDVRALFSWVRDHPEKASLRLMFVRARVLTLATGVPAMGVFQAPDSVIVSELRRTRITHVVVGDARTGHAGAAALKAAVTAMPSVFTREYANASFVVYRVVPGPGGA